MRGHRASRPIPSPWYTPSDVGVEASFEASQTIAARICDTAREQATTAAFPGVDRAPPRRSRAAARRSCSTSPTDADLLVVGARGHGGFIGLVLGSVSDQCARHAHIPVVVVPAPPAEKGADAQPG